LKYKEKARDDKKKNKKREFVYLLFSSLRQLKHKDFIWKSISIGNKDKKKKKMKITILAKKEKKNSNIIFY
jgi:hypothetical protein